MFPRDGFEQVRVKLLISDDHLYGLKGVFKVIIVSAVKRCGANHFLHRVESPTCFDKARGSNNFSYFINSDNIKLSNKGFDKLLHGEGRSRTHGLPISDIDILLYIFPIDRFTIGSISFLQQVECILSELILLLLSIEKFDKEEAIIGDNFECSISGTSLEGEDTI